MGGQAHAHHSEDVTAIPEDRQCRQELAVALLMSCFHILEC